MCKSIVIADYGLKIKMKKVPQKNPRIGESVNTRWVRLHLTWICSVWLDQNDCYWKLIFPVRPYYYAVMNLIYSYVFRSTSGLLWPARPSMLSDWDQSRLMGLSNSMVVLSSEPTRWIYPLTLLTCCWTLGLTLLHSWCRDVWCMLSNYKPLHNPHWHRCEPIFLQIGPILPVF